jgi:hypothetical protein
LQIKEVGMGPLSRCDVLAIGVMVALGGAIGIGMAPLPNGPSPTTYSNLRLIAQATSAYREDHQGYYPIVLSYTRGSTPRPGVTQEGWCTWSFGGKNNHSYWGFRAFDVEAADRPLNPYVIPDEFFAAPPIPMRMSGADPARARAQAPMFRDPGDLVTRQRNWPNETPGVTGYDDVGTSYQTNMEWWSQITQGSFEARFNEGTRLLAVGQGVHPSRFVYLSDQLSAILLNNFNTRLRIRNGYGDLNFVPLLFVDGHADYQRLVSSIRTTPTYTFRFEP